MVTETKRLGITINLEDLRKLVREFIDEQPESDRCWFEWRFEAFLLWLTNKKKESE